MTTLTLAFTEDFNAVAGRLREIGAKFTTRGSGATRTLVFSNMPESVLSLIRQWIERSSEAPVTDKVSDEIPETGEPETVNAAVAEPGTDTAETETEENAEIPGTPESVEEIADSPYRRYERPELEEMTVKAILSLAGGLAIDLSPVARKRKPEIIDRFLLLQQ
jgi:hypothetical protein